MKPSIKPIKATVFSIVLTLLVMIVAGAQNVPAAQAQGTNAQSLSGTLSVLWYDAQTPENTIPQLYLLDDNGNSYLLNISEETRAELGDIYTLNKRRVEVTGVLEVQALEEDMPSIFQVTTITFEVTAADDEVGAAITGSKPWVTILCKFNDIPSEPNPPAYFQGLFGTSFGAINHYWSAVSYGNINVNGSAVVDHWYTLPYPRSSYIGASANLAKLAKDCTAAANASVNYNQYFGINLMFNDDLDGYAWGGHLYLTLDGTSGYYPITWMPPWGYRNQGVVVHEIGHAFGLPHSSGPYGATYDSEWDVMSDTWVCLKSTTYGCVASDTISYHKNLLGWIPPSRLYTALNGTSKLLTIERLNEISANPSSYLMAKVIVPGSSIFYTVEVRDNITNVSNGYADFDEYDDNIPSNNYGVNRSASPNAPVVIIHQVNPSRSSPANVMDQTANNDPNDEGAMWRPGETFVDATNNISISVIALSGNGYSIRIRNGNAPNNNIASPLAINNYPFMFDEDTTTTDTAITDPLISCGGNIQGQGTVWYTFKPTTPGIVSIDTTTSNFNTLLAVWTGTPALLTNLACDDDSGGGGTSSLSFEANSGITYYIEVAGKTAKGDLSFHLNMTPCYTATTKVLPVGTGTAVLNTAPNCMGNKYLNGTSLNYSATPNGGYYFKSWSGASTSTNNPLIIPISSNQTLTANFVVTASTPTLLSPANNSLTTNYKPLFKWKTAVMATGTVFDHYQFQLATDNAFTTIVLDQNITNIATPEFTPLSNLSPNTKYYWRVKIFNTLGNYTPWSATWAIRTALSQPVPVSPPDAFASPTLRPTFDWDDVSGATGYTIQIAKNTTFTQIVQTGNPVTSHYIPALDLTRNLTLYWRVNTKGVNGPSAWSAYQSLNMPNPPGIPTLSLPASNALNVDYRPLFKWSVVSIPVGTFFDHYQLQVDDDSAFGSPTMDVNVAAQNTPQFQPLSDVGHNTKFYWRVRSFNTAGQYSTWSAVRYFRTAMLPPVLNTPSDATSLLNKRPSFDWADVEGATGYKIVVSKNVNLSSPILNVSTTGSAFTPTADLPAGTMLFWRVQATGLNGPGNWSVTRSFTTANPPGIPSLSLPASNALNLDYRPVFKWSVVAIPVGTFFDHYQLQVDDDPAFGSPALDVNVATHTPAQFQPASDLASNTKFYWRVRSFNTAGHFSAWSASKYFRVAMLLPGLVTPSNGSTVGSLTPLLDWTDVAGATSYNIQVSTSPTFATTPLVSSTTIVSEYVVLKNLPAGKIIYWRVRANGPNGPTAWIVFQFVTP